MKLFLLIAMLFSAAEAAAATTQQRIASDFEIAQMEQQLAREHGFLAQLSGHLNLGDVRDARNERSLARAEYAKALDLATREIGLSRRDSDITRYATATSYAALAQAKLGHAQRAFALAEEALRYSGGSAKTWNVYASTMTALALPKKAISAARNAVAIAEREHDPLDLAVYRYALASALGETDESEWLLVAVTTSLRSHEFDALRDEVARGESFEIYSTARGDAAAWLSLLNRSQLRLGALYERRGETAKAREQYERVLEMRNDDATALAALGRYDEALDANPFSMSLIREYRKQLPSRAPIDDSTTGGKVRRALDQLARGDKRAARETLDALIAKFPANETLLALRREAESRAAALPSPTPTAVELRALIDGFESLTPEQRAALDAATYTSVVLFDSATANGGQTIFESGTIDGVPFRFSEPIAFTGTFAAKTPLRLTYRILGVGAGNALLVEPLGVAP
jgi:tetratricopeptide (TPR) repeat protein